MVAQRLRRAEDEATAADARDCFTDYWNADGRDHFREEEEVLLPACAGFIDVEQPTVAKVLTDHVRIRHLAGKVASERTPSMTVLHELGRHLEQHVRHEERGLFPLIEQAVPEAELSRLVDLLTG